MKHIVILSGAGLSAESGIPTFRNSGGLWEGHRVEDVATPEAWAKNPGMVLEFYNQRRKHVLSTVPNRGHKMIAELESEFKVSVITQNVDDLHERAGSSNVLHLHGSLLESRSTQDDQLIYPVKHWEMKLGDLCEKGYQLRPNIVWFNEPVPQFEEAAKTVLRANVFIIVGTSLQVYPAAGLIDLVRHSVPKIVVDPEPARLEGIPNLEMFRESASSGMEKVRERLRALWG